MSSATLPYTTIWSELIERCVFNIEKKNCYKDVS